MVIFSIFKLEEHFLTSLTTKSLRFIFTDTYPLEILRHSQGITLCLEKIINTFFFVFAADQNNFSHEDIFLERMQVRLCFVLYQDVVPLSVQQFMYWTSLRNTQWTNFRSINKLSRQLHVNENGGLRILCILYPLNS